MDEIIIQFVTQKGLTTFPFFSIWKLIVFFKMVYASTFCTPKTNSIVEKSVKVSNKYLSDS